MSKLTLAMALRVPANKAVPVSATATGRLLSLEKLFGSSSTFALAAGTNANLQLDSGDGIKAVAALGAGVSQDAIVQVSDGASRLVQYKLTCTGAPVAPSVPAVMLTAGNGQISVAWVDGSTGGSAITSHRIYVNGTLVASPTSVSPYVITGLTNGTSYSVQVSAVNGVGESALSSAQSSTPSAAPPAPFTTLNADGYSTQGPTAMAANTAIVVTRQGFDATGAPISFTESIYSYGAYFQMPPTLALSATVSVLSDTLFATDSIPGVLNNNPDAPPKGILQWQQGDQRMVGNTLSGSLVGYHLASRNGEPFACVKVIAKDASNNTVSVTLTDCTVSAADPNRDKTQVWEYNYSLDVSGLTGDITVNAEGYPWIGNASSVAKSSDGVQGARGFVPQLYTRNAGASSYGAVNYVYVASGGSDSTGYVGPDYNAAKASPCATPMGARLRADAVLGTAAGACNGLAIVLGAGNWEFTSVTTTRTTTRDAIITRDPTVARASVVLQIGTSAENAPVTGVYLYDISVKRTGAQQFKYQRLSMRNVDIDMNGFNGTPLFASPTIVRIEGGCTVTGNTTTSLFPSGTSEVRQCRGLTGSGLNIEGYNVVGCSLSNYSSVSFVVGAAANKYDNFVIYSNLFPTAGNTTEVFNCNVTTNGGFFGNNLAEWITGSGDALGFSRDAGTANLTNVHVIHNTVTGAGAAGRINMFYDENQATQRFHKYNSVENNIFASMNHKNMWFLYVTQSGFNDGRTGALEAFHGTNQSSNFSQFSDAAGQPWFRPYYFGRNSNIGTSLTVRNDPLFTNYQGQTNSGSTLVPGTGGGTYTLQAGSSCRNACYKKLLPGGINGVAFAATPNMGAYG